jgi:hypothetical protein
LNATCSREHTDIMSLEIASQTPLAEAITASLLPKLVEVGWASEASDAGPIAEFVVLMLVNGKSQDGVVEELVNLTGSDNDSVVSFVEWLFGEVNRLQNDGGAGAGAGAAGPDATGGWDASQDAGSEMDTDLVPPGDSPSINAPTGPRSMRNGPAPRGAARDKRMFGQMTRAMDRSGDSALHRVRTQTGNERIGRGPPGPTGPRFARGAPQARFNNGRGGSNMNPGAIHALDAAAQGGMNPMGGDMTPAHIYALLEQQSRLMQHLSQQMVGGGGPHGGFQNRRGRAGRPLSERTPRDPNRPPFRHGGGESGANEDEGGDSDMGQTRREPPNPDETVCKFNQRCTNKDCPYAHASPAAPYGTTVDVGDVCSFGAACKNWKCVGRHPSPAAKLAHQSEQDCKFFPNCQNRNCPFKHPSAPPCRNGGECSVPGCTFTHIKTKCKFTPCMNVTCPFTHEEGQRGAHKDKVWTADSASHTMDRRFVDEDAEEKIILPGSSSNQHDSDGLKVTA